MRQIWFVLAMAAAAAAQSPEQRVDAVFSEYSKPGSPGCAVGVRLRGETALAKGYGQADLEQRLPVTAKSRFYMASVSKHFTSMALLVAEAEGKLSLDDSVRKWVPELPAYADGIPLRRLLDHTAGFRDYLALWGLRGFDNQSVLTEEASLAMIARQKALNYAPGTEYSYSNSGYLLAKVALQRATGKTLERYAEEKIYRPLRMSASRFQADHGDPVPDRAHGYQNRSGVWKTADVGFDVIGSGGMYSNIEDMLKWAANFEDPVIGAKVLPALQTPGRMADGSPTPGGYALGLISKDGTIAHSGASVGYSTYFLRVPDKKLTVVCLCNVGGAPVARLAARVAAIYGGPAVSERAAAEAKREAARAWSVGEQAGLAGEYWSEELFAVWRLEERDGKLWVQSDGARWEVRPAAEGAYRAGPAEARAVRDGDGRVTGLRVSAGRARDLVFTRR